MTATADVEQEAGAGFALQLLVDLLQTQRAKDYQRLSAEEVIFMIDDACGGSCCTPEALPMAVRKLYGKAVRCRDTFGNADFCLETLIVNVELARHNLPKD